MSWNAIFSSLICWVLHWFVWDQNLFLTGVSRTFTILLTLSTDYGKINYCSVQFIQSASQDSLSLDKLIGLAHNNNVMTFNLGITMVIFISIEEKSLAGKFFWSNSWVQNFLLWVWICGNWYHVICTANSLESQSSSLEALDHLQVVFVPLLHVQSNCQNWLNKHFETVSP